MLHKTEDGGFIVSVPALPGCITESDTLDEAMARAKEAIELYFEFALILLDKVH